MESDGNTNRIHDTGFAFDASSVRLAGGAGDKAGALWDAQDRMRAYHLGDMDTTAGHPVERYRYDAAGYRIVRMPEGGDGKPVISLRDGSGQLVSEWTESPGDNRPKLVKDFLYGNGQLWVERAVSQTAPTLTTSSTLSTSAAFDFNLASGAGAAPYAMDIRAASGFAHLVSGITPDAGNQFSIAETQFQSGTTNYLRIKLDRGDATPYSAAATLSLDPNVTGSSANQIRSMSIHRVGNVLTVRWSLLTQNGKKTRLYFTASGGQTFLLTPSGLAAGLTALAIQDTVLSAPCGVITATQTASNGSQETGPTIGTGMPPPGSDQDLASGGSGTGCGDPAPPSGPGYYSFANAFHHRDHLGNLRVVTDAGGWKLGSGHDYYPYGTQMDSDTAGGSRKRFTGHERDELTGMDYMLARYGAAATGRFLLADPIQASAQVTTPQAWNRFASLGANPLKYLDPDGREIRLATRDPEFVTRFLQSVWNARTADPTGRVEEAYQRVQGSPRIHTVRPGSSEGGDPVDRFGRRSAAALLDAGNGTGTGSDFLFNVDGYVDNDGRFNTPEELAAHMLSHMEDFDSGTHRPEAACERCPASSEVKAVQMENLVTIQGAKTTYNHGRVPDATALPTSQPAPLVLRQPRRRMRLTDLWGSGFDQ